MVAAIALTEERAITLKQLQEVWARVRAEFKSWKDWKGKPLECVLLAINLYHINDNLIRPMTKQSELSYVEMIAVGPQPPSWFVSHWWGEPSADLIACIAEHARLHQLDVCKGWWICAYANRQWALDGEISVDPRNTSFFKAMMLSEGTLSVVDAEAVAGTRIWCNFETATSLEFVGTKKYEIATSKDQKAIIISDGPTEEDKEHDDDVQWRSIGGAFAFKANRENEFPLDLMHKMLQSHLQNGQASQEEDRIHILNSLVQNPDLNSEPPTSHERYDELNCALHWRIGIACLEALEAAQDTSQLDEILSLEAPTGTKWQQAVSSVYHNLGESLLNRAKYSLALSLFEKERLLHDQRSTDYARVLYFIGSIHSSRQADQTEIEHALETLAESKELYEDIESTQELEYGLGLSLTAVLYFELRDFDKALDYCESSKDAFGAMQKIHADDPEFPMQLNKVMVNKALVLEAQGKNEEAMAELEQCKRMLETDVGTEYPVYAKVLVNIANLLTSKGELDRSIELLKRSAEIMTVAKGESHPDVAIALHNIGEVYFEKGSLDVALEFYERSQAIRLSTTGETGAAYGNTAFNIALVHQKQALKEKQHGAAQKAMDAYTAVYGADHPDTKQAKALRDQCISPVPQLVPRLVPPQVPPLVPPLVPKCSPLPQPAPKRQPAPCKTKNADGCCVIL